MYFIMDRCDNVGEFRCEIVGRIANIPHGLAPVYAKDVSREKDPKCKVLEILQIKDLVYLIDTVIGISFYHCQ